MKEERLPHGYAIATAVISECGWIFIGKHHGDCFHKAFNVGIKMHKTAEAQGFVTNKGRFVKRGEAADIAFKAGQIDEETQLLFSEDLWSEQYNGKHTYCDVKGYEERK